MDESEAHEANGLVFAFDLDGQGGGRALSWEDLETSPSELARPWIHLDLTDPRAQEWLRDRSGIDEAIVLALLEEDTRPRSVLHEDGVLAILRGVNLNPGAEAEDMVAIRIWLEPGRIITTRRRMLQSVRALAEETRKGKGPTGSADFLIRLAWAVGDRVGPVVDQLDEELESAEARFGEDSVTAYGGQFSQLRRRAAQFRRYLGPQRDALQSLSRNHGGLLSSEQAFELREESDRVTRYLEDLDLVRERAMVAQEDLLGRLAQQQNERMYILSIVAAIFLPLSFLTGLFGMNVAGLPGIENPYGFIITCTLMLASAVGIGVFFRWKGWF
ncbi:MAG: zinc transporter ZntB [Gammaproteobacteria bacterium]|jgi:zinc transporter